MTELTRGRVEELKRDVRYCEDDHLDKRDIADLLAILDDYSALKAENERLREENERLAMVGDDVIALYREEKARAEKAEAEVKHRCDQRDAALESCSLVSAENERLRKDNNYFHAGFDSVREDYEEQKARAEKAEAALESWKKDEVIWKETEAQLLAELARQAPLIEAVMGATPWGGMNPLQLEFYPDDAKNILRAALALREEKK
jgi:DNA repair exonuclease SbcCD ATPase subunit